MTVRINRASNTPFGQFDAGDIVFALPPHQEALLEEMGVATRTNDALPAVPYLGTVSAATMLATPSPVSGMACRVSDLGNTSPWFEFDGTDWRPLGRRQLVFRLLADTAALTLSNTLQRFADCSCPIPAGVLNFAGAGLLALHAVEKSAGVDTMTASVLFGANNSNADAAIANPSGTDRGHVSELGWRRTSATALAPIGKGILGISTRLTGGTTNGARASAVTVSTLAAANYLGLYGSASGTPTETALCSVFDVWVTG